MPDFENMVDIAGWDGVGYNIAVDSPHETWMTAIKNFTPDATLEGLKTLQKHPNSDEAFILVRGRGVLVIGEGDETITTVHELELRPFTVYNVRRHVWHGTFMSEDAIFIIVENSDTIGINLELPDELRLTLSGL